MKIRSDDRLSYIEMTFQAASSEDDIKISGRHDVNVSFEASCSGFSGRNESIWFGEDEIRKFIVEMRELEKHRKGVAKLLSLGHPSEYTELVMQVYSTDTSGHFAVRFDMQKIKYSRRQELRPFKMSSTFDLDSGDLLNIVSDIETLFASKGN